MIGIDLIDIRRVEKILQKYPKSFRAKVLSLHEEQYTTNKDVAKCFSVKESVAKAIGTGLRYPVIFKNISLLNNHLGKPYVAFSNELKVWLFNFFQREVKFDISISHEKDYLISIALIRN